MTRKPETQAPGKSARDARLKAALKANLGRRKAQAKARVAAGGTDHPAPDDTTKDKG